VFRVAAFQPNGEATGVECALPVIVVPAFYRRVDFWLVLAALAATVTALVGRAVEVGRVRRRVAAMEREQVLERERARIARDLHDEMGAGLSAIAMQSDWIRRECGGTASPETRHRIETVCQSAVELVRSVDEIVWAVNPSNDTVERFVNYLTQYTEQYLDAAGVRFRFDIPRDLPGVGLAGSMRHNLFLAVKEALRNAVKHAKAELLWLRVSAEGGVLAITVEDNGRGFDPGRLAADGTHNGVGNMRRRMQEVAGRFEVSSQPGRGTRVTFAVPLGGGEAVGSGQ
jgi:signal transduction histidine kinase